MTTDAYFRIPPDSDGKRITAYKDTESSVDYYTQYVSQKRFPTFYGQTSAAAIQTTNSQFAINNITASGLVLEITRVFVVNFTATGHAGVLSELRIGWGTGTVTGTASSLTRHDSTDAAPSSTVIAVVATPTSLGSINIILDLNYHTASIEAAAARASDPLSYGYVINSFPGNKGLIINPNEFFAVNFLTADGTSNVKVGAELQIRQQQ